MDATFCVYEHWRPDLQVPFYVGKGRISRARHFKRNAHHARIVAKLANAGLAVDVRIVHDGLLETDAYELERARIAHWRGAGVALSNQTDGGEGFSDPSGEIRARISRALKGRRIGPPSPEHREKIRQSKIGRKRSPEVVAKIAAAKRGVPLSADHRAKIGAACRGKKLGPPSLEARMKMRLAKLGTRASEETRRKMSDSQRRRFAQPS